MKNILEEANEVTSTTKREAYGDARTCCEKIAAIWSVVLDKKVTPEQVSLCMIGLKLVRETNKPQRDNLVDIAGYARVLEMCIESLKQKNSEPQKEPLTDLFQVVKNAPIGTEYLKNLPDLAKKVSLEPSSDMVE